jgi:vrille
MMRSSSMSPSMMSPSQMSEDQHYQNEMEYEMSSSGSLKRKDIFTQRKQREFIPDSKKDDSYWDRRRRNNEAAKRSREKRRFNDMVLEQRVIELTKENHVLKAQLDAIKDKYNISGENLVSVDQILATLPTSEQVLSFSKRIKPNGASSTSGVVSPYETPQRIADNITPKPTSYILTPSNGREQMHPVENVQIHNTITSYGRQNTGSPFEDEQSPIILPPQAVPIIRVSPIPQQQLQSQQQQQTSHQHPTQLQQPQVPSTPVITSLFKPLHSSTALSTHQPSAIVTRQPSPQQHHQPHDLHKFILLNKNGESLTNLMVDKEKLTTKQQAPPAVAVISNVVEKMGMDDEPSVIASNKPPRAEAIFPHIQLTKFLSSSVKNNYMPHHSFAHHNLHHVTPQNHRHHPHHPLHHHEHMETSVLNLSRRTCSNGSGSDIGNDNEVEHFGPNEYYNDYATNGGGSNGNQSDRSSTVDDEGEHDHDIEHTSNGSAVSNISIDHNSLPLKLRHKTHFLGEKESAATALLALHNIKQEPSAISHSPVWDDQNSSDERDSGISIEHREVNSSEWSNIQRKIIVNATTAAPENFEQFNTLIVSDQRVAAAATTDSNIHLKSHLARLESEIHTIKNMMILNSNGNSAPINA